MKTVGILMFVFWLAFTGCGRYSPYMEYEENDIAYIGETADEQQELNEYEQQYTQEPNESEPYMPYHIEQLTLDHILNDLDYMVYVLQNNFALLEVAYTARGVDYRVLASNAREYIYLMEEPCADMFLAILRKTFWPLMGIGHFNIFTPTIFNSLMYSWYWGYDSVLAQMNIELINSPMAEIFYVPRMYDQTAFNDALDILIQDMFANEEFIFNHARGYWARGWQGEVHTPDENFVTKVIEEGRIAYIFFQSMMELFTNWHDIFDFYREIQGFEHLIIDIRGNHGGNIAMFVEAIIRPNITQTIEYPLAFHFFMDGPYVRRFGENLFYPTISSGFLTNLEPYRPALEILDEFGLPDAYLPHFDRMSYGAPTRIVAQYIMPHPGHIAPIDGTIWLLTDGRLGSAAEHAAWISKETGFATLVGDIGGGVMGGPRTLAFMPNTGIIFYFDIFYITNESGRPLEAGTIPHYFNLPGMDALGTVLALIAERN